MNILFEKNYQDSSFKLSYIPHIKIIIVSKFTYPTVSWLELCLHAHVIITSD